MKHLYSILELVVLICMIALVHMKADVRMVLEAGFIYLATVIRENAGDGE